MLCGVGVDVDAAEGAGGDSGGDGAGGPGRVPEGKAGERTEPIDRLVEEGLGVRVPAVAQTDEASVVGHPVDGGGIVRGSDEFGGELCLLFRQLDMAGIEEDIGQDRACPTLGSAVAAGSGGVAHGPGGCFVLVGVGPGLAEVLGRPQQIDRAPNPVRTCGLLYAGQQAGCLGIQPVQGCGLSGETQSRTSG
ncbi:hypothetical protein GCM10010121_069700 [Streptomyces brasiliensis]|uniref:Uncharacterized protein n=1 Tax=Streptomyces brasiliensis TaxID=1954 RepID=A0A917L6W5_9ACTN|nr:hypothetical protein GCM10010121_069700 [Streptomyces brasiliensis]